MKLSVLAVGKLKEAWVQEGCAEYAKRVRGKLPLDLVEVKDDGELTRKIPAAVQALGARRARQGAHLRGAGADAEARA